MGGSVIFGVYAEWGWTASNKELVSARMTLLKRLREWAPRFRLLFPHPTPSVDKKISKRIGRMEKWLVRKGGDRSVPETTAEAKASITRVVSDLKALTELLPADDYAVRLVVDTNALWTTPTSVLTDHF